MPRIYADHSGAFRHMAGWKRQPHDPRDYKFVPSVTSRATALSLRRLMPSVRDQLDLGSCTANAGVVATEFCLTKQLQAPEPKLSRLDLYAVTRDIEGTPLSEDSGCYVRDVYKASNRYGICYENLWPYVTRNFSRRPPRRATLDATRRKAMSYHLVEGLASIKACIAEGYPIIFGFDCYESIMSDETGETGVIPMPEDDDYPIGGHCVTCIGYDDRRAALEIQNSWGTGWGDRGFGWLPYGYVTQRLATDFWTLRKESVR